MQLGKTMFDFFFSKKAEVPVVERADYFGSIEMDIHSHLVPGIDDGCRTLDESLTCIRRLKEIGFVGTICTPHYWPRLFPENLPVQIAEKTELLRAALGRATGRAPNPFRV